jgi:hypothetical protein
MRGGATQQQDAVHCDCHDHFFCSFFVYVCSANDGIGGEGEEY